MALSQIHQGHRKRVKDEFRNNGLEHFAPHRVLELLLYYVIPRRDTNPIAHQLLDQFGSLSGVLDAPIELLCTVDYVGEEAATYLKLISGVVKVYMEDINNSLHSIDSPQAAKQYMSAKFLSEHKECIYIACLAANGKVLYCKKIAQGSPETVSVVPKEIVKTALRVDSVRVVIAHNHPNGFCNPSRKDLQTTSILYSELQRVDILLEDHIIVASDGICSMRESNMFPAH